MAVKSTFVMSFALLTAACGSPSEPTPLFEVGVLDTSGSVLATNPEVVALGNLRVRVRVVTVASACSSDYRTVTETDGPATVVLPLDEVPGTCSSRAAKLHLHEEELQFRLAREAVVIVRTRDAASATEVVDSTSIVTVF